MPLIFLRIKLHGTNLATHTPNVHTPCRSLCCLNLRGISAGPFSPGSRSFRRSQTGQTGKADGAPPARQECLVFHLRERCGGPSGLARFLGTVNLGLRSSDSLQPRLLYHGPSALKGEDGAWGHAAYRAATSIFNSQQPTFNSQQPTANDGLRHTARRESRPLPPHYHDALQYPYFHSGGRFNTNPSDFVT